MPTSLLYALVIVYVIIAIFAFLLLTMPPLFGGAPKMGWGKGFMVAASWPLIAAGMPFVYAGYSILSYFMEPTEEERRKLNEQNAKFSAEQDARLQREQAEINATNAKMAEANVAALRERQVAQVTEIKTTATTVPAEPAAANATAVHAK